MRAAALPNPLKPLFFIGLWFIVRITRRKLCDPFSGRSIETNWTGSRPKLSLYSTLPVLQVISRKGW